MQNGLVYQIKPSSVTRAVSGVVFIQWRVFQRVNKIAKRVHMLEKKRCEKKIGSRYSLDHNGEAMLTLGYPFRFPHKHLWLRPDNQKSNLAMRYI